MSNTITPTVFYPTLNVEGVDKSTITKPVPGMLPPLARFAGWVRAGILRIT